jgi:hypothetical protein
VLCGHSSEPDLAVKVAGNLIKPATSYLPTRAACVPLLRQAINREGTELCVLLADLSKFLLLGACPPCLDLLHAVPDLHNYALRRFTIKRSHFSGACPGGSAYRKEASARRFDDSLSLGGVFLRVTLGVGYVDLGYVIHGRFGLRMDCLDSKRANSNASEH